MPDDASPQHPDRPKRGARIESESRAWTVKPLNQRPKETTRSESEVQIECARRATRLHGHKPGPAKMFHPGGRFRDETGECFDYLFPELLEDPALPPWVFERVPFLLRGTKDRFQPRRAARESERIVVGLRYGYGDLPRIAEER